MSQQSPATPRQQILIWLFLAVGSALLATSALIGPPAVWYGLAGVAIVLAVVGLWSWRIVQQDPRRRSGPTDASGKRGPGTQETHKSAMASLLNQPLLIVFLLGLGVGVLSLNTEGTLAAVLRICAWFMTFGVLIGDTVHGVIRRRRDRGRQQ